MESHRMLNRPDIAPWLIYLMQNILPLPASSRRKLGFAKYGDEEILPYVLSKIDPKGKEEAESWEYPNLDDVYDGLFNEGIYPDKFLKDLKTKGRAVYGGYDWNVAQKTQKK